MHLAGIERDKPNPRIGSARPTLDSAYGEQGDSQEQGQMDCQNGLPVSPDIPEAGKMLHEYQPVVTLDGIGKNPD
jgi:hypothetical protein